MRRERPVSYYSRSAYPSLWSDLLGSLRSPSFWLLGSWLDVVTGYRRLWLGVAWAFIPFATFCVVLGTVYASFSAAALREFLPYLSLGFWFWRFFVQAATESCSVLSDHRVYILQGNFRITDYVCKVLGKGLFNMLATAPVVLVIIVWSGQHGSFVQICAAAVGLFVAVSAVFFTGVWVSIVAARYPAIREVIGTVLLFGFLLTPIMWRLEDFALVSKLAFFVYLNPVTNLVEIFRAPLLGHDVGLFFVGYSTLFLTVSVTVSALVYRYLSRSVALWK